LNQKSLGKRYEELTKEIQDCYDEVVELSMKFACARKHGRIQRQTDITNEITEIEMKRDRLQKEKKANSY
jgi:hypothetical protein